LGTIALGLTVRFAPLGLPHWARKWGGSMLWAVLMYWLVKLLLPHVRTIPAGALAGIAATAVEFFKLYNPPWVDAFRSTIAGIVLLGRIFSWWDILAYWAAIGLAALLDSWLRRRAAMRDSR